MARKELLLHALIIDLARRFTFKQFLLLELFLHIIDVLVKSDAILCILIPKLQLVAEALSKLISNLIVDVIVCEDSLRGILQEFSCILGALEHELILLEHTVLILVNLSLDRLVSMRM